MDEIGMDATQPQEPKLRYLAETRTRISADTAECAACGNRIAVRCGVITRCCAPPPRYSVRCLKCSKPPAGRIRCRCQDEGICTPPPPGCEIVPMWTE